MQDATTSPLSRRQTFTYVSLKVIASPNKRCRTKFRDAPPITTSVAIVSVSHITMLPSQRKRR